MADFIVSNGTLDVQFPLTSYSLRSQATKYTAEVLQKVGTHDVVTVSVPNLALDQGSDLLGYGTPAITRWSTPSGTNTLFGYVHDYIPYADGDGRGTKVVILSAGMPLKQRRTRVFTEESASSIAEKVAREHGLHFDIEPHPRVFYQVVQDGISDWEMLAGLAKRIGYSLRVEGVTLQFVSLERLARYYRAQAPDIAYTRSSYNGYVGDRSILEFTPLVSRHQQVQDAVLARHVVQSLDLNGNTINETVTGIQSPGRSPDNPVFTKFHDAESAQDATEARFIAQGHAESNRYPIRAHAMMWGDVRIQPNRILKISGLNDGLSGYWTVLETRHLPRNGTLYQMEVLLGTESLGEERFAPGSSGTSAPQAGLLKMPYPEVRLTQGSQYMTLARGATVFEDGPRWSPV